MTAANYLIRIKSALATSSAIRTFSIREEWIQPDRGYFRARCVLTNDDFLEVMEYFVLENQNRFSNF